MTVEQYREIAAQERAAELAAKTNASDAAPLPTPAAALPSKKRKPKRPANP